MPAPAGSTRPSALSAPRIEEAKRVVWINGRFLSQEVTGVQRSARELVRAIEGVLAGEEIDADRYDMSIVIPPGAECDLDLRRIRLKRVGKLRGHAWEQVELPWHCRGGLLLSLCNVAPVLKRPQLVVLHDAAVFAARAGYSRAFATWYRAVIAALRRSDAMLLTPSDFSRDQLCRLAGFTAERIRVIRWGAEHITRVKADVSVLIRHRLTERPYLLAVGSLNPNKNFATLVRALESFRGERPALVIAGGLNSRVHADEDWGRALAGAIHVGFVSDGELKALYERATAFVFPSLYEGFGLPPLEAMACGCPVIAADIPPVREVCGTAATYFEPTSPEALREAIVSVLSDPARITALRSEGAERARAFSWDLAAREVLSVIDGVALS